MIDSLERPGGQVTAIYPEKLSHEVAGSPPYAGVTSWPGLAEQSARFAGGDTPLVVVGATK